MTITNFIQFDNENILNASGTGLISTLTHDFDIEVAPVTSNNDKAPTHRVYAKSPRGHRLEVGGIWKRENLNGGEYFTLAIRRIKFNANLGRFPGQDDTSLQVIIEWEPRD